MSAFHLMIKYLRFFVLLDMIVLFGAPGCSYASSGWEYDEILTQLSEIKAEVSVNKKEISALKESLEKIGQTAPGTHFTSLSIASLSALGDKSASIGIVEFTDFQYPYCVRHFKKTLPQLKTAYIDAGKVQYFSRQFPLSFHKQARLAGAAALCSEEQNSFWGMHEKLFENSRNLTDELINSLAEGLSLDKPRFNNCLNNSEIDKQIDQDILLGQKLGVKGTPKFFIGRIDGEQLVDLVPLSGAQPYSAFQRVIESFLTKN